MLSFMRSALARKMSAGSSPRFLVYDPSLMTAAWSDPIETLLKDPTNRGHLVESAIGSYLLAQSQVRGFELRWWRDGANEVDFVARKGSRVYAIEVKSGRIRATGGLVKFCKRFEGVQPILIGDANLSCEEFLRGKVLLFS
jgi:predicted AAA+ superfamily ATPase